MFPFLPIPLTYRHSPLLLCLVVPVTSPLLFRFRLWSSENQLVGVGSRSRRINQSQCTSPRSVIGLVLPLQLVTPTIWFSPDHKWNISYGVVSGIRTLFSLHHKLYASDHDSNSIARENQSLLWHRCCILCYSIACVFAHWDGHMEQNIIHK